MCRVHQPALFERGVDQVALGWRCWATPLAKYSVQFGKTEARLGHLPRAGRRCDRQRLHERGVRRRPRLSRKRQLTGRRRRYGPIGDQNSGSYSSSEPVVTGTLLNGRVTVGGGNSTWTYETIGVVHPPLRTPGPGTVASPGPVKAEDAGVALDSLGYWGHLHSSCEVWGAKTDGDLAMA